MNFTGSTFHYSAGSRMAGVTAEGRNFQVSGLRSQLSGNATFKRTKGLSASEFFLFFCRWKDGHLSPSSAPLRELRTGLINIFSGVRTGPQGLKPAYLAAPGGTAEAVPSHKPFMRRVLRAGNRQLGTGCCLQSPKLIPIARAARTISPAGSTVLIFPTASAIATAQIDSCCRQTIFPKPPVAIESTALTP
jgi:hypothetical protein